MMNTRKSRRGVRAPAAIVACLAASILAGTAHQPEQRLPLPPMKAAPANPAASAGQFTVELEGARQGRFKGEGTRDAAKDKIVGLHFEFNVATPHAPGGTGKRAYEPMLITKEWGAASPQIFQAAATGETLSQVLLNFYRNNAGGENELFYSIKLADAHIASLKQYSEDGKFFEELGLTFQKIEVIHVPSGKKAEDAGER